MPTDFESRLQSLTADLTKQILAAIQSASLSELAALGGQPAAKAAPAPKAAAPAKPAAAPVAAKAAKSAPAKATKKAAKKGARRSSEAVQALQNRVVEFVNSTSGGVSIGEVATKLGEPKDDLSRPLSLALQAGQIKKQGEKAQARYFPGRK
jgi:hypothetical protein